MPDEAMRPGYIRELEVKLWVEERELEALHASASSEIRQEMEREIERLRELVRNLRQDEESNSPAQRRRPQ